MIVTKLRECISQWTFTVHCLVCVFSIAIWVAPNEWLLSIIRSIKCLVGKPRFSWGTVASFALQLCYRTRRPLLSLPTFDEYGTTYSDKIRGLRWDGYAVWYRNAFCAFTLQCAALSETTHTDSPGIDSMLYSCSIFSIQLVWNWFYLHEITYLLIKT